MNSESFITQYRYKALAVAGVAIVILLNRLLGHALMHAMQQPVFLFEQTETVYRLFLASGIPQFVTGNAFVSIAFDVALFVLPLAFVFTLRRGFAIAFSVLLLIYFFTYNLVTGHHYHGLAGAILITIPFWTKNPTRFELLWQACRYYLLYIFSSAALWKILRGSVFYKEQMSNILKAQQLDLLLQQPDSFRAQAAQYLIANPDIAHAVLIINVVVQLCFLVGFFTRRADSILFILLIVFCAANYFVMNIVSAELLILNLTLLNWDKIQSRFPKKWFF